MGTFWELLIVFCVVSGIIGSRIAKSKGRDPFLGFAIGLSVVGLAAAAFRFAKEQRAKKGVGSA